MEKCFHHHETAKLFLPTKESSAPSELFEKTLNTTSFFKSTHETETTILHLIQVILFQKSKHPIEKQMTRNYLKHKNLKISLLTNLKYFKKQEHTRGILPHPWNMLSPKKKGKK